LVPSDIFRSRGLKLAKQSPGLRVSLTQTDRPPVEAVRSGDALHACEIAPPPATQNPRGARTNQTHHGVYEAVQPALRVRHSPALRYGRYLDRFLARDQSQRGQGTSRFWRPGITYWRFDPDIEPAFATRSCKAVERLSCLHARKSLDLTAGRERPRVRATFFIEHSCSIQVVIGVRRLRSSLPIACKRPYDLWRRS
jgi:hypothetical protein